MVKDMTRQLSIVRPAFLLRAEAGCALLASCLAYHWLFPHHWGLFALLFLVPDLSLLLFLRGPGAVPSAGYNLVHSYVLPLSLGVTALARHGAMEGEVSLIWVAHIAVDRMLGFGLKYATSFQLTHIQSADAGAGPE